MPKKKWMVNAAVVGGKHIGEYEAETGEQAIQMAQKYADVSLCHQCSSECEDAQIESLTASCGQEVVYEVDPDEDWQRKARAAGWKPPKAKKTAKRARNGG